MREEVLNVNVCLAPTGLAADRLIQLARDLPRDGQRFRIGTGERIPHLSLYMCRMLSRDVWEYHERLTRSFHKGTSRCTASGISITANGYVEVAYNRSERFEEMQATCGQEAKDLWLPKQAEELQSLNDLEQENEMEHGYKLYGDLFRPHVTLAKYPAGMSVELPGLARLDVFDFNVSLVTIGRADDYGSVVEVLQTVATS